MNDQRKGYNARACGGNAVYGLGLIRALIYYIQAADGFWVASLACSRPSSGPCSWSMTC